MRMSSDFTQEDTDVYDRPGVYVYTLQKLQRQHITRATVPALSSAEHSQNSMYWNHEAFQFEQAVACAIAHSTYFGNAPRERRRNVNVQVPGSRMQITMTDMEFVVHIKNCYKP